jgi:hypothetical protein
MAQSKKPLQQGDLPLEQLFRDYLNRQVEAQATGLGYAETSDEVAPYDLAPVQPIDPHLAWQEARGVLTYFAGLPVPSNLPVPPDWALLVAGHEPAVALAFCLGNFPQLVRTVQPLLTGDPRAHLPHPGASQSHPALVKWASQQRQTPHQLLAAAVLRLAKDFDGAKEALGMVKDRAPEWAPVTANERAAVAWHAGRCEEALKSWQDQEDSIPVLFNRGMAQLFLGRPGEARGPLLKAAAGLPDSNSWHHLAQLYLAMGQARGE